MATLTYAAITSLDGYVEDRDGNFDWAEPDEEVHDFVNQLCRPIGTYLYGRRMYEVMQAWETDPLLPSHPQPMHDFASIWQAADKVVYSTTLQHPPTARTRIERHFEPDAVADLKQSATRGLTIGGAELARHAFAAGLVDEFDVFLVPYVAGGGKRALPEAVPLRLHLLDQRRFGNGTVYLRYRVER